MPKGVKKELEVKLKKKEKKAALSSGKRGWPSRDWL